MCKLHVILVKLLLGVWGSRASSILRRHARGYVLRIGEYNIDIRAYIYIYIYIYSFLCFPKAFIMMNTIINVAILTVQ